jgi:molecular chaperone DnaK
MIDARNELDTVAYQVERRLAELGDAAPVNEKARAEIVVSDARQAIKEEAPLTRLRSLTSDLQQIYHGLNAAAAGARGAAPGGAGGQGGPQTGGGGDDDVIDAEFTTD